MIDQVPYTMLDNWRITIRELSGEFIWFSTEHSDRRFGHEMGLSDICPETADSLDMTAVARILLQCADQDVHFMKTVITSDESWVYGCDPETKAQSSK